ncbi:40S ribosomal protein S16, putative [Plasmodium ovale curtisi]|uniref:40S ribosomal protein S16, putative n=1 Tax=Plasmodium ovale curtisi TaxID=864141 RepID=A0A1A8W985_PLAOA|nr:40S ribosomal protein S16, putative [Plasmodium ovale curtisi]SBS98153.1 40S ribosomal protein S16, putative [Plasmodium ovale curtisi]
MTTKVKRVQTFGKKKTSVAVATVTNGKGLIKLNGKNLDLVEPYILKTKVYEPLWLIGAAKLKNLDIRIRVKGGGQTAQIYAIRQAIGKGIISYYQKYVDESTKKELKDILLRNSEEKERVPDTRSRTDSLFSFLEKGGRSSSPHRRVVKVEFGCKSSFGNSFGSLRD